MLATSSLQSDRDEAARRWASTPAAVRQKASEFLTSPGFASRQWPPAVVRAAESFLEDIQADA
eukprot:scaffold62449_cov37-Tisochrysis_lutea.AAC.1